MIASACSRSPSCSRIISVAGSPSGFSPLSTWLVSCWIRSGLTPSNATTRASAISAPFSWTTVSRSTRRNVTAVEGGAGPGGDAGPRVTEFLRSALRVVVVPGVPVALVDAVVRVRVVQGDGVVGDEVAIVAGVKELDPAVAVRGDGVLRDQRVHQTIRVRVDPESRVVLDRVPVDQHVVVRRAADSDPVGVPGLERVGDDLHMGVVAVEEHRPAECVIDGVALDDQVLGTGGADEVRVLLRR